MCVFAEPQALPYERKYISLKLIEEQSHKLRKILFCYLTQDDGHALLCSISQDNLIHMEHCLFFTFFLIHQNVVLDL